MNTRIGVVTALVALHTCPSVLWVIPLFQWITKVLRLDNENYQIRLSRVSD